MTTLHKILRLIKFEHTLFALPLAYVGAVWAAGGWPGIWPVVWILLAMVGARSAAMAFNRLVDRRLDALNPRTADRAIPRGELSRTSVALLVIASVLLFFVAAANLNLLCLALSPVALVIVLGYSYTKRFTWWCHIFLGASLAIAPLGGYLAVRGSVDLEIIVFAVGVVFWVAGFDVIYACQDIDFDQGSGLRSLPVKLGGGPALRLSGLFHALSWLAFLTAGLTAGAGWAYFAGLALVGALLYLEHRLVSPDDLSRLEQAFFTVNSYVSVALLLAVVADQMI